MKIVISTKQGLARFEQDHVVFTDTIEQATAFDDRYDAIVTAAQYRLKEVTEIQIRTHPHEELPGIDA